jgi:hypothetical protein
MEENWRIYESIWWNEINFIAARHQQHNISFLSFLPNEKKEEMLIAAADAAKRELPNWICFWVG